MSQPAQTVGTERSILAGVVLHGAGNAAGELASVTGALTAETTVTLAMAAGALLVFVHREARPNRVSGGSRAASG